MIHEPTARERIESNRAPSELLDHLARPGLSRNRRRELVAGFFIAAGERADADAQRAAPALCALGDRMIDGDTEAIEAAREWVVEHTIARNEV